jgi:hypothetical protein
MTTRQAAMMLHHFASSDMRAPVGRRVYAGGMATCDPDGRILQALMDRQKCLLMEMHESLAESAAQVAALLPRPLVRGEDY